MQNASYIDRHTAATDKESMIDIWRFHVFDNFSSGTKVYSCWYHLFEVLGKLSLSFCRSRIMNNWIDGYFEWACSFETRGRDFALFLKVIRRLPPAKKCCFFSLPENDLLWYFSALLEAEALAAFLRHARLRYSIWVFSALTQQQLICRAASEVAQAWYR